MTRLSRTKLKETDIRAQVRDYLRLRGWFVYYNLAGLGAYRGVSDLVAVKNGCTVWIELKQPKGQQSEFQKQFQADIEAAGGIYLVVRSLEDIQAWEHRMEFDMRAGSAG